MGQAHPDGVACVDISGLEDREHNVVHELMQAAQDHGFFQVVHYLLAQFRVGT